MLPEAAAALLEPVGLDLDLVVSTEPSLIFRDGSVGHRVRFDEATGSLRRDGQSTPAELTLAGRTVEMRTFADGELLDVTELEHAAGLGRYGDIFDLIFPILTPSPPKVSGRDAVPRAMHWPVRLTDNETLLNTMWAQWSLLDSTAGGWHLGYEGRWSIRGSQEAAETRVPAGGDGSGSGEVWMSRDGVSVQRHTFQWQRTLVLIYAPHEDQVIRLKQTQSFTGELERL